MLFNFINDAGMTTPHASYDWLRTIQPELKALDEIPLTGASPPFPWDELSNRLAKTFEREGFKIQSKEVAWRSADQLLEGLGDIAFPLHFAVPTFNGTACWIMPEQEMILLETWLLTKESHPLSFQDKSLSESFYRFFALETLFHFSQLGFDKTLTPILKNSLEIPSADSLCLDISLSYNEQMIWGRLIISPEMRHSWIEHFSHQGTSALTQKMAQEVEVQVHLEAGKTAMTLSEWNSIELGDLLLLDSCSLEPPQFQGRVLLTVNNKTAFRGKLKEGTLKILELPALQEMHAPLEKRAPITPNTKSDMPNPTNEEEDDDLSDLSFTEEESFALEDSFLEDELTQGQQTAASLVEEPQEQPKAESKLYKPEEIPVQIIVEVGRIQMSMEQLLRLEPGNLLEVAADPANGVDLTINGRTVGRGELLKIGEALGVRILELG